MTRTGEISQRFVSLQDIYPTLIELGGLNRPEFVDGRSLVTLLKNPDTEWTNLLKNPEHAAEIKKVRALIPSPAERVVPIPSRKTNKKSVP